MNGSQRDPMKRTAILTGLYCFVLAILAFGVIRSREQYKLNVLYQNFLAEPDPSKQQSIVDEIAMYGFRSAVERLMDVAGTGEGRTTSFVWPQVRVEAIRKLHGHGGDDTSELLARLLQPHEPLLVRDASANELLSRTCARHCMDSVLHYLEREHRGEASTEVGLAGGADYVSRHRVALHNTLLHLVQKNSDESVEELRDIYGLGSFSPSPFALVLLSEIEIRGACPHLIRTQSTDEQYRLPHDPLLDQAITMNGCQTSPGSR